MATKSGGNWILLKRRGCPEKKVLTVCVESGVRLHEVTVNETSLAPCRRPAYIPNPCVSPAEPAWGLGLTCTLQGALHTFPTPVWAPWPSLGI